MSRGVELAAIGDEKLVSATIRDYHDAGATEVVVGGGFADPADEQRTWELIGELNRNWF